MRHAGACLCLLPIAAAAVFGVLQLTASAESGEALGAPSEDGARRRRADPGRGSAAPARAATAWPAPIPPGGAGRRRAACGRPGGPKAIQLGRRTEFGSRQVLAVAAQRGDWLGVVTPQRPNNRLAWVHRRHRSLRIRRTRLSLHADLSARTLTLRRAGRRVYRLRVAIGRPGIAHAHRPLRGHRQAGRRALRLLLRLLHPGPQRPPAEPPAGLDRGQPPGDPRHQRPGHRGRGRLGRMPARRRRRSARADGARAARHPGVHPRLSFPRACGGN